MNSLTRRQLVGFIILAVLAIGFSLLRIMIDRPPGGELGLAWPDASFARFRWSALSVAAIVGASLAVSGVLLQALLRNPLASPFILGLSSGAGLGVMVAMYVGHVTGIAFFRTGSNAIPALIGALVVLAIVYGLGQKKGWLDPVSLVLIGVVVSAICGALTMFIQHLAPGGVRNDLVRWMFGSIGQGVDGTLLVVAGVIAIAGIVIGCFFGRAMDVATFGDDEARSVGVSMGPLRLIIFMLAGLLAAMTVALAGPIGFVGLVAPHAARLVIGPRHGPLVVGASLAGIVMVVSADVCGRVIVTHAGGIPVGVFTALIGGPAFIWLLRSGKGQA